jgi:hypothetical protein
VASESGEPIKITIRIMIMKGVESGRGTARSRALGSRRVLEGESPSLAVLPARN